MLSVVNFVGRSNGFVIVRLVALWVMHIGDWQFDFAVGLKDADDDHKLEILTTPNPNDWLFMENVLIQENNLKFQRETRTVTLIFISGCTSMRTIW